MSTLLRKKITKSLDVMNTKELRQAWLILKEISPEKKLPTILDPKRLNQQITEGIRQLDDGKGTDLPSFINGLKKNYGKG